MSEIDIAAQDTNDCASTLEEVTSEDKKKFSLCCCCCSNSDDKKDEMEFEREASVKTLQEIYSKDENQGETLDESITEKKKARSCCSRGDEIDTNEEKIEPDVLENIPTEVNSEKVDVDIPEINSGNKSCCFCCGSKNKIDQDEMINPITQQDQIELIDQNTPSDLNRISSRVSKNGSGWCFVSCCNKDKSDVKNEFIVEKESKLTFEDSQGLVDDKKNETENSITDSTKKSKFCSCCRSNTEEFEVMFENDVNKEIDVSAEGIEKTNVEFVPLSNQSVKDTEANMDYQNNTFTMANPLKNSDENLVDNKETEGMEIFMRQSSGLQEQEKYADYTERFPEESEENRKRWAGTLGCYLTFDKRTQKFHIVWSAKPVARSIGFFSCPPDIVPYNKTKLNERNVITERGPLPVVARIAWMNFIKTACRYDGEFVFLTSDIWKASNFNNIEIVLLQEGGLLGICKKGSKPYKIYKPLAFAVVENSFRFQSKRRKIVPKWSRSSFATTAKSLGNALYSEVDANQRIQKD